MFSEGSKTILLVDDDELIREFIGRSLAQAHFKVVTAKSGKEALWLYGLQGDEIDLVVTDILMPGLFGDQLAVRLWEQVPTLPILFISGHPPEDLAPGVTLELGQNFLRKPFKLAELLDMIRRMLVRPEPVPAE
jgi:DNA-binding response OmpR family regulator